MVKNRKALICWMHRLFPLPWTVRIFLACFFCCSCCSQGVQVFARAFCPVRSISSMSALTLLLLGLLPSLAALRPELALLSSTADGEEEATSSSLMEAEGQGRDQADPRVQEVTVKPAKLGIAWNTITGKIVVVDPGSQEEKLGLKVGQYIVGVGKKKYRHAVVQEAVAKKKPFQISVKSPTQMEHNIDQAFHVLGMLTGLLGLMLIFGLPWVMYSHLTMSDSEQQDGFSKALSHPLPLTMMLAYPCGQSALVLLECSSFGVLAKMKTSIELLHVAGLVLGLHLNKNNKALSKPLSGSYALLLRKTVLVALNICTIALLSSAAATVNAYIYVPCSKETGCSFTLSNVSDMLFYFGRIPTLFAQFVFTCYVARITLATRQQMFEVQSKMPCKPTEFFECVHTPCAVLLDNSIPELVTCGWPLVLAAPDIAMEGFLVYLRGMSLFVLTPSLFNWLNFISESSQLAGVVLAVVVGPLNLSSALKDFQNRLNEERKRDATLHTQIEGVETMLERHNCGQGFGIPVFDGFVLTKGLLQNMCIRLALVGAAIKTFLDAEMGFAKEPEEDLGPTVASIASKVHNISMLLTSNMSNHTFNMSNHTP